jgi:tryptophan 2,3-dioxygenase
VSEQAQRQMSARDTQHGLATLNRVKTILAVCIRQVDVLVTMTPRQFNTFRSRLEGASGFQSAQFRELEAILGRRGSRFSSHQLPEHRAKVEARLREWRFRHVMTVDRTIGTQQGTGGSSGVGYLSSTLQHPHSFPELWEAREAF